jgi:hypothetical protein
MDNKLERHSHLPSFSDLTVLLIPCTSTQPGKGKDEWLDMENVL